MIKKFEGSVVEVMHKQGMRIEQIEEITSNLGYDVNKATFTVDLPRAALVDFGERTHSAFSDECSTDEVYQQQYKQGNVDGGVTVDIYMLYFGEHALRLIHEADELEQGSAEYDKKNEEYNEFSTNWIQSKTELRFAYHDQQGVLCCFGLVFNWNQPDRWAVQIVKNTTGPLEERTTSLFTNGDLVTGAGDKLISAQEFSKELEFALNAPKVHQLLSGLLDKNKRIILPKYEELRQRIRGGFNLDDRDSKKQQFKENMSAIAVEFKPVIDSLVADENDNIDFYKAENFSNTLHFLGLLTKLPKSNQFIEPLKALYFSTQFLTKKINQLDRNDKSQLKQKGTELLDMIYQLVNSNPSRVTSSELEQLQKVAEHAGKALDNPFDGENIKQLGQLAKQVSGHSSSLWKALGAALIAFTAAVLIVAGVLAAIPTGGASLGLVVAGAAALTGAGGAMIAYGQERGLAKKTSLFKSALSDLKPEEVSESGESEHPGVH